MKRCYTTLLPFSPSYLATLSSGSDLYGPFWVSTTLILALFLSSSLAASISKYLSAPGAEYDYNFGLLGLAATIVYAYSFGVPVALWLALRYLGVGEWGIVDALGVWGYALFVWIPVSVGCLACMDGRSIDKQQQVLCVIPESITRWVLVGVAFGLSGYYLGANVYPILSSVSRLLIVCMIFDRADLATLQADAKATRLLIIVIAVLHGGLALTFKGLFFSYYVVRDLSAGSDPLR